MKYMHQAAIILLFTFLGEAVSRLIPLGIPGAIWGLLLLFLSLCLGIVKVEQITECSNWMITILPVLFVAPTVNLLDQADALAASFPAVAVMIVCSTFLTFAVSGRVTQRLHRRKEADHD